MNDTSLMECPSCGKVEVPDRDVLEELIPGSEELVELNRGVGFRCPRCGIAWWKDVYDYRDHWRRYPIGLRP
jgi:predicted RNA-binding Zn-ribbon protein involved in translation (DUF1610 family)